MKMLPKPRKWVEARGQLSIGSLAGIVSLALLAAACTTAAATTSTSDVVENSAVGSRPVATPGSQPAIPSNELCLACHSKPGLVRTLGHTEEPLETIGTQAFATSAHGGTACAKCHPGSSAVPHASAAGATSTVGAIDANQVCASCHREAAEGYAHTVHGVVSNLGDKRAPGCTDCHTAHSVKRVSDWSSAARAQACARCHEGADATFAQASTGHREASATWFAPTYFAGRFLVVLLACTLAFGTLHVELDMLRWGWAKVRRHHDEEKSE
jgi:hypothetical protein